MTDIQTIVHTSFLTSSNRNRKKWRPKRMSGKYLFRALVRRVIENRSWLEMVNLEGDDIGDNVRANIQIIQSKATRGELRLGTGKVILRKDPQYRTEEEITALYRTLGDLKCFRRYPEDVRRQLVAHTFFVYYGPNRTLMRQGHDSTFMGVVLTGELSISHTYKDPVFGNEITERKANLMPGTMVGEVALVHNTARTATVVTATAVELLVLNKNDFDRVLKATLQAQWDEIKHSLIKFPYFSLWGETAIRELCILSDIKRYKEHDVILGLSSDRNMLGHFILKGNCIIAQTMTVEKNGKSWKLCQDQSPTKLFKDMYRICMQVCVLTEGACFGIGENLSQRTIIAETNMSILRIPNYILQEHNTANIWTRIQIFQNTRIPSLEEIFQKFLEDRKWEKYCASVVKKIKVNKSENPTTIHDVPLSLRSKSMHCDDDDVILKTSRKNNSRLRNSLVSYNDRKRKSSVNPSIYNLIDNPSVWAKNNRLSSVIF